MAFEFHGFGAVAVAGWPSGLLSDTVAEVRVPLYRSDSIVFRDTWAGAGAQVLATPAFVSVGPRVSLAPIDVFDVNLKLARAWYFDTQFGLMGFDGLGGTLEPTRAARAEDAYGGGAWIATVEPTLKAKVGPVIAFYALTVDWLRIDPPAEGRFVYEPYRDLVLAPEEVVVEHQGAVLVEKGIVRAGLTLRDRSAVVSHDVSTNAGPLVVVDTGEAVAAPTIVGLALFYLRDTDRLGGVPLLAAQVRWDVP